MGATSHGLNFGDTSPENSLMHSDGGLGVIERQPDFSGWASKYGLKCSDGRTILHGAFENQHGERLPLVWQHGHAAVENVLGFGVLEHRDEGPYVYGYFNETAPGKHAKELVAHGDIGALSIFANQLIERAKQVSHGIIREISLVLAAANPGALIDNIEIVHSDGPNEIHADEAIIYTGLELEHGAPDDTELEEGTETSTTTTVTHAAGDDDPTIEDVFESMTPEQKEVVTYMVGAALNHSATGSPTAEHSATTTDASTSTETTEPSGAQITHEDKDDNEMSGRNVFESARERTANAAPRMTLSHDAIKGIADDAKKRGSFKEAVEHYALQHGIENIDVLFPDARTITDTPEFDRRRSEWVQDVLTSVRKSPFSRIKSIVADITHAEARAKGYIKGTMKKDEFFGLTKRVTTPSTIYKKQRLDRDDIIDITDFDVVLWLKAEMRLMLDEEIARAILIGDGRDVEDEDKISDPSGATSGEGIRSILNDDDLYAATITVDVDGDLRKTDLVDKILENMRYYKGSGLPTFYTTLPVMTQMLLSRDSTGRRYYRTATDLASELGVAKVVPVEVMEAHPDLIGIAVNLQDYTMGADRGGEISFFDDFDIDYNQYKYLIETRASGALTKIRSALVFKQAAAGATRVVPNDPTFDSDSSEITIHDTTGITYRRSDTNAAVTAAGSPYKIDEGKDVTIFAIPNNTYFVENNVEDEWTFRGTPGA